MAGRGRPKAKEDVVNINTTGKRVSGRGKKKTRSLSRQSVSRRSSTGSETSLSQKGSRYRSLTKTCSQCNEVCLQNGREWNSVECVECKAWFHPKCTKIDLKILEELQSRKMYLCDMCKDKQGKDDSGTSEMDTEGADAEDTMNSQDNFRAAFDEVPQMSFDSPPLPEGSVCQKVDDQYAYQEQGATGGHPPPPKASTPKSSTAGRVDMTQTAKEEPTNPIEKKLDDVMNTLVDLTKEVQKNDVKLKTIDAQQHNYLQATTFKLKESVHGAIGEGFKNLKNQFTDHVDKKINNEAEKIEKKLMSTIDQKVDKKMDQQLIKSVQKKIESKIDQSIKEQVDKAATTKINQLLDKNLEEQINNKIETALNNKLEGAFDSFQERLWRRKNVMIVNLPESDKANVEDRMYDDREEVDYLFNKITNFDINEIDGMPVRVGKISYDYPRLLRVTLKSERMVKDLVYKAKKKLDILNPQEKDKKKKIYINKDFTQQDRQERKEAYRELRERASKGEEGLTVRKNRVVRLNHWEARGTSQQRYQPGGHYRQDERYDNYDDEEEMYQREDLREPWKDSPNQGISPMNRQDVDENVGATSRSFRDDRGRDTDRERDRGSERGNSPRIENRSGRGRADDRGRGSYRDHRHNRSNRDRSRSYRERERSHEDEHRYNLPRPLIDDQHRQLNDRRKTRHSERERGNYRDMHYGRGQGGAYRRR